MPRYETHHLPVLLGGSTKSFFAERSNSFAIPIQFANSFGNPPVNLARHQIGAFAFDGVKYHNHMVEFAAVHGRFVMRSADGKDAGVRTQSV